MVPPKLKPIPQGQVWIGIDPGMKGAIGAIDTHGRFLWVKDLPVTKQGRKGEFDLPGIAAIVEEISQYASPRVLLEWPTTRPGEAAESSKRFGVGLGILEGMFVAKGHKPERISPNGWKGRLGLSGKKDNQRGARQQAVDMAEEFIRDMPEGAVRGPRGGLMDGRAEALLIAWEGLTRTVTGLRNQPEDVRLARMILGSGKRRRKGKDHPF